jgi:uncharacterized protein
MADFHIFGKAERQFLYFSRSARLYELDPDAARMLSILADADLSLPAGLAGLEAAPALPALSDGAAAEFQGILREELAVPPPSSSLGAKSDRGNFYQNFSIYISQACNFSCCYCWNKGGGFGKVEHLMDLETAHSITRLITHLAESSTAEDIRINFYGGEPLLNFAALRQITLELLEKSKVLGKRFFFNLDTNGYFLEAEIAQFLARHFSEIGISLDGRQEIHDHQRPTKGGGGTWKRIVANLKAFPNPELLGVRGTLTTFSDSYGEMFHHLAELGIRRVQLEYCHEPGYKRYPEYEGIIVEPDRQHLEIYQFIDQYITMIKQHRDLRDIPYVSNLFANIAKLKRGERYTRPCGAGVSLLAFNSRGVAFPCIAFVDYPAFAMGRAEAGGELRLPPPLADYEVDVHDLCGECWARYDCAGGCYATHFEMTGNVRRPHDQYCHNHRSKTEIYLYALARIREDCPWHLEP